MSSKCRSSSFSMQEKPEPSHPSLFQLNLPSFPFPHRRVCACLRESVCAFCFQTLPFFFHHPSLFRFSQTIFHDIIICVSSFPYSFFLMILILHTAFMCFVSIKSLYSCRFVIGTPDKHRQKLRHTYSRIVRTWWNLWCCGQVWNDFEHVFTSGGVFSNEGLKEQKIEVMHVAHCHNERLKACLSLNSYRMLKL